MMKYGLMICFAGLTMSLADSATIPPENPMAATITRDGESPAAMSREYGLRALCANSGDVMETLQRAFADYASHDHGTVACRFNAEIELNANGWIVPPVKLIASNCSGLDERVIPIFEKLKCSNPTGAKLILHYPMHLYMPE